MREHLKRVLLYSCFATTVKWDIWGPLNWDLLQSTSKEQAHYLCQTNLRDNVTWTSDTSWTIPVSTHYKDLTSVFFQLH
jgi:hypothetical protein